MTVNKNCFYKLQFFFLNESTEAEEEEPASGTKFPGSEQCILSQASPIRRSSLASFSGFQRREKRHI